MERKKRALTPMDIARRDSDINTTDMEAVRRNADDTMRARLQLHEIPEQAESRSPLLAARLALLRTLERVLGNGSD